MKEKLKQYRSLKLELEDISRQINSITVKDCVGVACTAKSRA